MKTFTEGEHVCLVIPHLSGKDATTEGFFCDLANILADSGYKVTCLYFDKSKRESQFYLKPQVERINLYGPQGSAIQRKIKFSSPFRNRSKRLTEFGPRTDFFIYQLHDYFNLVKPSIAVSFLPVANISTLLAAKGTNLKVVATNTNIVARNDEHSLRENPRPIDRDLQITVLDGAAAIQVAFPECRKSFPAHLREKIVAIPNYIPSDFRPQSCERQKIVLAVGQLSEAQNYLQLIRSWATLSADYPDWKVKILGVGPQKRLIQQAIERFGVGGSIEFQKPGADRAEVYSKAAIFCHPALSEGFGQASAEALFAGLPVVCYSDCTAAYQLIRDGYNGLAVPREGKTDELAAALRRLIDNRELRETLGRNGPESVRSFTLEDYRRHWLNLIEKIADGN